MIYGGCSSFVDGQAKTLPPGWLTPTKAGATLARRADEFP